DSENFTIDQAPSTVSITCPDSVIYNGSAQEPCTAEATGAGMSPVDLTDDIVYGNNTNAGTATVDVSWAGDANHTGNSDADTFEIEKAESTTTVTCTGTPFTYDGNPHGCSA